MPGPGGLTRGPALGGGKANEITYYLTNSLNAKTVAGPDQQPVRWEMVRFTLRQTFKMDRSPSP